jgi:hypothetical protein
LMGKPQKLEEHEAFDRIVKAVEKRLGPKGGPLRGRSWIMVVNDRRRWGTVPAGDRVYLSGTHIGMG